MKWVLTVEVEVFDDRDPREWHWPFLIDVDDDVDFVDFDTLTLTPKEA